MSITVEVPDPLAARLAAEAARRGVDPEELAVETLEGALGSPTTIAAPGADPLDAFIGCGSSGRAEPFDVHAARADLAARKRSEGA